MLADHTAYGGSVGGQAQVDAFAIAKYPITNAQYQRFIAAPNGYKKGVWWGFSPQGAQYWQDRSRPNASAFAGADLPRTRVSWFDSMAFCAWLSAALHPYVDLDGKRPFTLEDVTTWCVCLPTEPEWQWAAAGDTGWAYPWGDVLDETRANYNNHAGQPTAVTAYASSPSPFGVVDMMGNVWEWCLTQWGNDSRDVNGYGYRANRGGAWNVGNPDHLQVSDRACHPPRGRLNDAGFRCVLRYL